MTAARTAWRCMHGVNLDMLGRRDPPLYGTLTLRELEDADRQPDASELGLRRELLPDQLRGRVRRAPARAARQADARDPEPRRLDALRLGDPRRARDRRRCRPWRSTSATSQAREPWRTALGDRRPVRRRRSAARASRATAMALVRLRERARGQAVSDARAAPPERPRLGASCASARSTCCSSATPANLRYLTGFTGSNGARAAGGATRAGRRGPFFTDFRYDDPVRRGGAGALRARDRHRRSAARRRCARARRRAAGALGLRRGPA